MTERIIGGRYRLIRLLGEGGSAEVYLAQDIRLGKYRAVKKMKKKDSGRRMMRQEAEVLSRLKHPALPEILDWVEEGLEFCLVLEYVEGRDLEQVLREDGPADGETVCRWGIELCGALEYLHSLSPAVLHQDLKPSNLMLTTDGTLKLIDLGAASLKFQEGCWGTRGYSAPERRKKADRVDERADIYSFGITLYRLASGRLPPGRTERKGRIAGLSGKLSGIIRKCMESDPERRFRSCRDIRRALERCRENRRAPGRMRFRRRGAGAAASLACAGILLTAGGRYLYAKQEEAYYMWLARAQRNGPAEDQAEALRQAVSLCPDRTEAYALAAEMMGEDLHFSGEEERFLLELLEASGSGLRRQGGYQKLAFRIGELYWYYYSGEKGQDGGPAAGKYAVPWFWEAYGAGSGTELGKAAELYATAGTFYRDLPGYIRTGQETGRYREFWDSLVRLYGEIEKNGDLSETARLEFFAMCLRAADCWRDGLRNDGIGDAERRLFCREVAEAAERVAPESREGKKLLEEIRREAEND